MISQTEATRRSGYVKLVFACVSVGLLASKGHAKPDSLFAFSDMAAFVEPSFICINRAWLDTVKLALQECADFASEMARLVERAAELVPLIRDQVESPLMGEFENLSMWIAAIVMMLSFERVLRENDGGSKELYYWVGRLVFCMILFGTGPTILNSMEKMGQAVVWDTPIRSAYDTQGQKFEENYKKFLEAGFTVQGEKGPIGVLTDNESPVKSIDKALNPSSWNMPQVFTVVTVARGLMEFADSFCCCLGSSS